MVVNAARGSHMTDYVMKLTQLLQPEQSQDTDAAKKRRIEELKARLAKDEAKAETASAAQAAQNKRRVEELKAKLAANPRFKIRSGTGEAFIMPGGTPPKQSTSD
jgi:hypothetical protein